MDFTNKLKETRLARHMTQVQLSKETGISQSMIALYENGKRKPSFEMLEKLSNALRVSTDYLLGRTDDPTPPQAEPKTAPSDDELVLRTPAEIEHMRKYRNISDNNQHLIDVQLDTMYSMDNPQKEKTPLEEKRRA